MEGKWKVQGYLERGTWNVECTVEGAVSKEGGRPDTIDAQLSQTSSPSSSPSHPPPILLCKYSNENVHTHILCSKPTATSVNLSMNGPYPSFTGSLCSPSNGSPRSLQHGDELNGPQPPLANRPRELP